MRLLISCPVSAMAKVAIASYLARQKVAPSTLCGRNRDRMQLALCFSLSLSVSLVTFSRFPFSFYLEISAQFTHRGVADIPNNLPSFVDLIIRLLRFYCSALIEFLPSVSPLLLWGNQAN